MTYLKGGSFLTHSTNPEDIFISEEWNEEQRMIADMVREFCIKNIQEPMLKMGREFDVHHPEDKAEIVRLLEEAGKLGLCGVAIEEQYGGMNLDFNTGLLFSEVIALGLSFATTIGAQTSIGSLPIVYYGTDAQKAKYLPGIATGELKAAYCLTEPTAGSDASAGKTKATLSPDGENYLLNGQKIWITNGGFADVFIVFAKIEDDEKLSAFIVEKVFGGISLGAEEKKMGIKGSSTVQVFFDNCSVPKENLLSERGAGFKIALNILNTGRIKLGAGTIGGCKFCISKTMEYAVERKQFGKPIVEFGAIKHKFGEMIARTFAIEAALYRTGRNIDLKRAEFVENGMLESEAKLNAIREFAVECSILKIKGSEAACFVTDEGIQIFGGMGYASETGIETGYRDARITKIYEGTNEINRMLSVGELTKRAIQTKEIDLMTAGKKIPFYLFKQLLPFKSNGELAAERRIVQNLKYCFLLISGTAGRKLGKKLVDEQEIVLNFSDILAEAYIGESVLLKYEKLRTKKDVDTEKLAIQKKIVQLYLYEALDIARKASNDAIAAYASGGERRRMRYLVGLLLKPYDVNPKALRRTITDYCAKNGGYCF